MVGRIRKLNPSLGVDARLKIRTILHLPGGPKYGATELSDSTIPSSLRAKVFNEMSKKAYDLGVVSSEKLQNFATRFSGSYVSSTGQADRAKMYQDIQNRGLVYPIDQAKHPESQLRQLQVLALSDTNADTNAAIRAILKADPGNLLPGMFPMSDSQVVHCQQPCLTCAKGLQLPANVDVSRARVLVEDTGIQSNIVDAAHLIPSAPGDDGKDSSPEYHGTFVYSQIAAADAGATNLFGAIPQKNVYVVKATQEVSGTQYFSMPILMNGWKDFSTRMSHDSNAATTWVVNISAFGEPVPDPNNIPTLPNDGHLLIVAAAGNDGSVNEPAVMAFPRLGNGSTPLLVVGAVGVNGKSTNYSNSNPDYVHLFAQGDCVCGSPGQINGTSQAVPFVTSAAAILASANPGWNPRYIMWRLLATADHPGDLAGKAFAGIVNLPRALDPAILVQEKAAGANVHRATSIRYDTNWKQAFQLQHINNQGMETLRVDSPTSGPAPDVTCFSAVQILYLKTVQICVGNKSKISITENGNLVEITADAISSVILPMPELNNSDLPDVIGNP